MVKEGIILCIETTAAACSVALFCGNEPIGLAETSEPKAHATQLVPMIQNLMADNGIAWTGLAAIAVSLGPGSYTGLRIGLSTAKGICFAQDIPLIGLVTPHYLAAANEMATMQGKYAILLGARKQEMYCTVYEDGKLTQDVHLREIDATAVDFLGSCDKIAFFNAGEAAALLRSCANAQEIEGLSAQKMGRSAYARLAAKDFDSLAYLEPYYFKDFIVAKKKTTIS